VVDLADFWLVGIVLVEEFFAAGFAYNGAGFRGRWLAWHSWGNPYNCIAA
jgi:hypothetical protein